MVLKEQEFFVKYDIESNTQYVIENDEVVKEYKFETCPYVWFGEFKEKIESGLIKWVMWRKIRFVRN